MLGERLIQAAAKKPSGGGGGGGPDYYVACSGSASPYVRAVAFNTNTGFGTTFSIPTLSATTNGIAFEPGAQAIGLTEGGSGSATVQAWQWSSSGFGTKYTNASSQNVWGPQDMKWSPSGDYVLVSGIFYDCCAVWGWSNSTGFGTKYALYATNTFKVYRGISWHPNENYIAVSLSTAPYVEVYPWSSSGWGSKVADPTTAASGSAYVALFSPDGNSIAVSTEVSPYIDAYYWTGSGFGSKYANPATAPSGNQSRGLAFAPDSSALACTSTTGPLIHAYPFTTGASGGFGSKFADPSTALPGGTSFDCAFTDNGAAIMIAHNTATKFQAYEWSSSGFGSKYANPGTTSTLDSPLRLAMVSA
jgi:hypothetical protein